MWHELKIPKDVPLNKSITKELKNEPRIYFRIILPWVLEYVRVLGLDINFFGANSTYVDIFERYNWRRV